MRRRTFLLAGAAGVPVALRAGEPIDERTLPHYGDGTARINALLGASLNVVIPAGTYMITGELSVRDGHVIAAAAGAQVTLKASASYGGRMMTVYDKRFTLRGLTLDGAYAERLWLEGSAAASLIHVEGGTVILEDNRFQYGPSFGIWAYRSAQMQVRGNTFLECYHPIRLDGNNLQVGVIEGNTFTNTAAFASIQHITAINTVNLAVRGNTMRGAGLKEPKVHDFEGTWGNSIYIYNSTGHLIEGNNVGGNWWSAVVSGQNAKNGIIRNNTLGDGVHTYTAIWIEMAGAEYITVDGNEIGGAVEVGDTGGDHVTITNNTIRSRHFGINLNSAAKDVLIQGNQIFSKAGYRFQSGVYLWEKKTPDVNVRLLNNHIAGFDQGVAINNAGSTGTVYGIRLSGNTFASNNVNVWVPSGIVPNPPLGQ
jgi:hypothetical protein